MKTTVEEIKKNNFKKTIDKSQNLMYNKYVRLREEKPNRMNFPRPLNLSTSMPVWWNGRHSRLKICGLKRVGSNPTIGTKSLMYNR